MTTNEPQTLAAVLNLADAGWRLEDIATATGLTVQRVYSLLRKHRPGRPRAPHRHRFNPTRFAIVGLLGQGHPASRVAKVLGVSRTLVYRVQGQRAADLR